MLKRGKKPNLNYILLSFLSCLIVSILMINGCEKTTNQEKQCLDSGGKIEISDCCNSSSDFPNNCLIGACGCAPEYSHPVKTCRCPENKCFNGEMCVSDGSLA